MSSKRTLKIRPTALVLVLAMSALITGIGLVLQDKASPRASSSPKVAAPTVTTTTPGDYYNIVGPASLSYSPTTPGVIEYCPVDELGRALCAYGELTTSLRKRERTEDRQDINVDPSGWGENAEVDIPALPDVAGSASYHGWFWNRSHLVADSLGGDAIAENLVTGTRTQNVGSTHRGGEASGGMAYTEALARAYLDTNDADACPLYYAATANYSTPTDLVPSTVTVDIHSCDGTINEQVKVQNRANGFTIDYQHGTFQRAD